MGLFRNILLLFSLVPLLAVMATVRDPATAACFFAPADPGAPPFLEQPWSFSEVRVCGVCHRIRQDFRRIPPFALPPAGLERGGQLAFRMEWGCLSSTLPAELQIGYSPPVRAGPAAVAGAVRAAGTPMFSI